MPPSGAGSTVGVLVDVVGAAGAVVSTGAGVAVGAAAGPEGRGGAIRQRATSTAPPTIAPSAMAPKNARFCGRGGAKLGWFTAVTTACPVGGGAAIGGGGADRTAVALEMRYGPDRESAS